MNNKKQVTKININMPPIAAACVDGHQLAINHETGDANLLFIQLQPHLSEDVAQQGIVVANIRLNVSQLRQLNENISKVVEEYGKKPTAS